MKSLSFVLVLAASSAFCGNYIDNPNFDLGRKGWAAHDDKFVTYYEKVRHQQITDQYLPFRKSAQYIMRDAPRDVPFYFTIELSHECGNEDFGDVEIDISGVSYTMGMSTPVLIGSGLSQFYLSVPQKEAWHLNVLSKKRVKVFGCDRWHVISSDFPVYLKSPDVDLLLTITSYIGNRRVHLNYAQIGTDPTLLGGRGPRDRAPPN